jgi:sugar/nucleoside kinase (ribokinase family)
MSLLVVGSVALDSVKTPFGEENDVLGGSATYFSVSAGYFTGVNLVAVVGEDFPEEHINLLKSNPINIDGLEKKPGKTFRWKGSYNYDLNEAHTLDTQLNVFADFDPKIPESYKNSKYVFLANIDPDLQIKVLDQITNPKLIVCDTMNYWIEGKLDSLKRLLSKINILIINDSETRELGKDPNVVKAAQKILSWGPDSIIVKRGEYGSLMFSDSSIFSAPAYPLEFVFDPTGAGDSFAGGFMGYISKVDDFSEETKRKAIIFGSTMASFNVEKFSLKRLQSLTWKEIEKRFRFFKRITHFEDL